jgi:hypothetical protein
MFISSILPRSIALRLVHDIIEAFANYVAAQVFLEDQRGSFVILGSEALQSF